MYSVDKATGAGTFCQHGGGCYPRYIMHDGQPVEAVRLTNCQIDEASADATGDTIAYDVVVVRRMNSSRALRENDVYYRLQDLDVPRPCAGNASVAYTKRPKSRLGVLVRKALEGDPDALATLQTSDACGRGELNR